jgi:hypothetical protein
MTWETIFGQEARLEVIFKATNLENRDQRGVWRRCDDRDDIIQFI